MSSTNVLSKSGLEYVASLAGTRVTQLDGLRGVAVALVVLFHYFGSLDYLGEVGKLPVLGFAISNGWAGVDLFFVMSGFLIGRILMANRKTDNLFSVFYFRRVLRIFPLYYLLLGVVSISVWAKWLPRPHHANLLLYMLYLQNIVIALTHDYGLVWLQPTWSLAVEEHFYLLLPALVAFCSPKILRTVLFGGIVVAISSRFLGYLVPVAYPRDFARFFTLCRIDDLFYGVLLALLIRREQNPSVTSWIRCCYAGIAIFGLGFMETLRVDHRVPGGFLVSTVGLSLLGPFCFCIVAVSILHEQGWIALLGKTRPLRWIGVRAYAIYLFHMPVLEASKALLRHCAIDKMGLTAPLSAVLTISMAAASWRFIEAPLISMGHMLKYRSGADQSALKLAPKTSDSSTKKYAEPLLVLPDT